MSELPPYARNMTEWTKWLCILAIFGCACSANTMRSGTTSSQNGYPVVRAPEFIGSQKDWINSKPLSMKKLRGKVVVIDFWEYTCVNCIRTFPYLKEWYKRYHDKGLEVVAIHTPEFAFAKKRENVMQAAKEFGFEFPVLNDSENKNWNAYANQYWPRKYLINKDGKIIYDHAGEGGYGDFELKIQQALKEINPSLELPKLMEPVRDTDKAGAVCYPVTGEIYAGLRGFENGQFGHKIFKPGRLTKYVVPGKQEEGVVYLQGPWTPQAEHLDPGKGMAALILRYKAKEINAVLKQAVGPVTVFVLQDGKPLAKQDAGKDIRYNSTGMSYITVDQPRMYNLAANAKWGSHVIELAPQNAGLQVYSFTFGSACEQS